MKMIVILLAFLSSVAQATTYHCESAKAKATAEFQFENGSPVDGTMTYQGITDQTDMMLQFMEDYQEVAGKSVYVQVAKLDYSLLFNATYVAGSTTEMSGTLDIFASGPMKSYPLTCTAQ